jgi:hypothetical protein
MRRTFRPAAAGDVEGAGLLLPWVVLRVTIVLAGLLAWAAAAWGRSGGVAPYLVGALLLAGAVWPDSPFPAGFLIAVGGVQVMAGGLDLRLAVTVAGLHAVHVQCAVAAGVPIGARFEPRALRGSVFRFAAIQAITVSTLLLAVGARTAGLRTGEHLAVLIAVFVSVSMLIAALMIPRLMASGR